MHTHYCPILLTCQMHTDYTATHTLRYIVKYWVKILHTDDNKYIRKVYNMLTYDMEVYPDKPNWCTLLNDLLCTLGMYDAWYFQEIGNMYNTGKSSQAEQDFTRIHFLLSYNHTYTLYITIMRCPNLEFLHIDCI